MSVPLDDIARRKLLLAKQLFHNGGTAETAYTPARRIQGIIAFDWAIETTLKTAMAALDPKQRPKDKFPELLDQIEAVLTTRGMGGLPEKTNIAFVHGLRNDGQHHGRDLTETDFHDAHAHARSFLSQIVPQIWGVSFESLSLASSVQDAEVRAHLLRAHESLEKGNNPEAVKEAAIALESAFRRVESLIVGERVESDKPGMIPMSVSATIATIQGVVLTLALGISLSDSVRYRSIAPLVSSFWDGNNTPYVPNLKSNYSQDDAEFVVRFATEAILLTEHRTGGLVPKTP